MSDDLGTCQCRHECPRAPQDPCAHGCVRGEIVHAVVRGPAAHHGVRARDDVRHAVRTGFVEHPLVESGVCDEDHLATDGPYCLVADKVPRAESGAVDDDVDAAFGRQVGHVPLLKPSAAGDDPLPQPGEVTRHVDNRRGERPAVGMARALSRAQAAQVRHRLGPRGIGLRLP